ncbi:PepSY domain-containing protein [Streptomyces sp. NPDC059943]|uniref:PepSY domain-containing protein n=1 Tax=Streptomyces sp. NPDC059943 TaxID=3347010 RepID=UPI0036538738
MKRNLVIASITAAALISGGTYTAVAMGATDTGADAAPKTVSSASLVNDDDRDDRNEPNDDRDDNGRDDDTSANGSGSGSGSGKDDTSAAGSKLTAAQAAAAALKQHPGKVESVDLDDDDDDDDRSSAGRHWEVDIIGQDGKWYDLRVDASTGAVRADNDDDDDDDDRQERDAVRGAQVDAGEAAAAALKKHPGAVTSIDSDDDDRKADHWEVTVRGDDGRTHEVTVDMSSGKVAADRDDSDDRDDDGDDGDDRDDDRGDDDGDDD